MITTPVRDDIRVFAAAVRTHLDDLPADEVDDLLDGLEADLADQAAEAGDAFELPDATTYAAELRAAAGLPERRPQTGGKRIPVMQIVRDGWRETGAAVRKNPAAVWVLDLAATLRPVWWLARGIAWYFAGYAILLAAVPSRTYNGLLGAVLVLNSNVGAWLVLIGLLLLSVQWGRGRWLPWRGLGTAATIGTILILPILFGLYSSALSQLWSRGSEVPETYLPPGLSVDGQRVRNIYAFDADGNPIPAVQLFDQDGNALTTVGRDVDGAPVDPYFYGGGGPVPVPYLIPGGNDAWNVYPLREIPAGSSTWDSVADMANAKPSTFPFERVQPLPADVAPSRAPSTDAAAGDPATPTPTPSAAETVAPTPEGSVTP
ncbi:hypothetical protein [Microbacterium enclense]|uniref:hypothetical protein n=1 Tax=Microbacterium enclense TaxID=993073 RepID=UPI003443E0A3